MDKEFIPTYELWNKALAEKEIAHSYIKEMLEYLKTGFVDLQRIEIMKEKAKIILQN